MISIIHPSRQRAEKSLETLTKWIKSAGTSDIEIIISIDLDDLTCGDYYSNVVELRRYDLKYLHINVSENKSAIEAINKGAVKSKGDILIIVSDDTDCPENWAVDLLKEVKGKKDWILKTQDGIQSWLITMPIMDREYYNRFGYIYHPYYQHCFCDTELTCVAELTGRKIESKLLFPHNHYSVGKAVKDAVSEKADSTYESGKKIFIDRKRTYFGLPPMAIKGVMTPNHFTTMQ